MMPNKALHPTSVSPLRIARGAAELRRHVSDDTETFDTERVSMVEWVRPASMLDG
jgi:hypothetical protein